MTSSELRKACEAGKIQRCDLVCRDGSDRWVRAEAVRGLFPDAADLRGDSSDEPLPAAIRPLDDASASESQAADAFWKTAGALFCFLNLAVCGLLGYVKAPPESVRMLQSGMKMQKEVGAAVSKMKKETDSMIDGALKKVRGIEAEALRGRSPGSSRP